MKFSINTRKSWFWHWFVMTSWRDWNDMNVYRAPIAGKYLYPFSKVEKPDYYYSNKYECNLFFRHRAIRHKNCPVYWGLYGGENNE